MKLKNKIIKSLHERKSVRSFEDKTLSPKVKRTLFKAATQAPTAGNQQLYSMIDITDPELKAKLAVLCDNQGFITKAPMVVIFLADCSRWLSYYELAGLTARKPAVGDLLLAVSDATIAAQNMVVAAQSLELGSCYIGDVMEHCEEMRTALNLPPYVFPCTMLVIGHPTPSQLTREKPKRFPLKTVVMENGYNPLPSEKLISTYEKSRGKKNPNFDFTNHVTTFCKRKYESEFSLEMSRSVATYLKEFMSEE